MKEALVIFAKNFLLGKVKTRLAATVGDEKAYEIYRTLVDHTAKISRQVNADKYLYYSDHIEEDNGIWNDNVFKKIQTGNDLGEKMSHAFEDIFSKGYVKVAIIGTDCLEIGPHHIHEAFEKLDETDVVMGPAADGGYYLLAMKKNHASLFNNISWGTKKVLDQTLSACRAEKLSYALLPELHDIDEEKDWLRFTNEYHNKRLLFVYNANGDMLNSLAGFAHKMFSPSTYTCSLCMLTHGNFGIRKDWKNFIDQLPFQKTFLHKDEFRRTYPDQNEIDLPAVFLESGPLLSETLSAPEINSLESIHELKQALLRKLNLHDQCYHSGI